MASYVDNVLQPGETVRYTGTLHWIIFLPAIVLLAFAMLAGWNLKPWVVVGGVAMISTVLALL